MDWGAIIQLSLAILGAALIAGGIVAYRGSPRTGVRAFGASAAAGGGVMWAIVLITVSVSSTGDATPTPVIVVDSGSGGIEGTVTCLDGEPVAGMRIAVVSGTASFPEIAPETDQEGHYRIGGVSPGTFEVAVHDRDGQRIGLASVTVTSGGAATLDFSVSAAACGE